MLVVFANNQTLVDYDQVGATITTDPVPVGDNNRATGITVIHKMFNPKSGDGLTWKMQGSNDGVNWMDQGPAMLATTAQGTSFQAPAGITCVYARLQATWVADASVVGAVTFDIHVNFDRE